MAQPQPEPHDPMAVSPETRGYFFHTLCQANAENAAAEPCADVQTGSDSVDTVVADGADAANDGTPASTAEKDLEKGTCPPPDEATTPAPGSSSNARRRPVAPGGFNAPGDDTAAADSKENHGWRRVVHNFAPSWFSVCMGTGMVAIVLHNLPYNAAWVRHISSGVLCLNIALFLFISAITVTRYVVYPESWSVMIKHPTQSLFLGCVPMAFSTTVKMMVYECVHWGHGAIYLTWAFWWAEVVVACASGLIIPFVIVHHHRNQLSHMTATLLLPVVPVVVASASGAMLADILPSRAHAVTTLAASYVLWGLGEVFAFFILTVYFLRLQIHDLPPREVIVSVFLPISPLAQGSFAIQMLGKVAYRLLPATGAFNGVVIQGTASTGSPLEDAAVYGGTVLYMMGIVAGLFLWGAALGWLSFAIISIMATKHFPFNVGWWGFVFPLGVLTSSTGILAIELNSTFYRVITMMLAGSVCCLWILVAVKTVIMLIHGNMFYAPCLRDLHPKDEVAGGNRTV